MDQPIQFTPNAALILGVAAAIRDDKINLISALRPIDDTTTRLFLAFILIGRDTRHSPSFAPRWLVEWIRKLRIDILIDINEYIALTPEINPGKDIQLLYPSIVTKSIEICNRTNSKAPVSARHILSAFLITIDASESEKFRAIGLDISEFSRDFFRQVLNDRKSSDDKAAWAAIFSETEQRSGPANANEPEEPGKTQSPGAHSPRSFSNRSLLPGYTSDAAHGPDALGITEEAEIFARLICYQDATPPLSIGLFGDWGSGKSFFMDAIEAAVDRLVDDRLRLRMAARTRALPKDERLSDVFVTDVMQLRFNAWHYADGDTFTSLTAEIFDQLRLGGHKGKDGAARQRLLDLVGKDIRDTEKRRDDSLKTAEDENKAVKSSESAIKQLEDKKTGLVRKTLGTIADEAIADLLKKPSDKDKSKKTRDEIDKAGKAIGIDGLADQSDKLRAELAGVSATGGRLDLVLKSLANGNGWTMAAIGAVATLAAVIGLFQTGISEGVAFLARLTTVAAPVVGLLAALLRAYHVVHPIIDLSARYAERLKEKQDEIGKKIQETSAKLAKARAAEAEARAAAAAEDARLATLPGSKTADDKAMLLRYFLFESADSRGFEQSLGVIYRARRAFETLDAILIEYREFRALCRRKADEETLDGAELAALEAGQVRFAGLLAEEKRLREEWWSAHADDPDARPPRGPIPDRIVLYIDDLDRCRTDQVVKVLEAVHLLLAFRSFIVVVGVDARWMRAALADYYAGQLVNDQAEDRSLATPDDYLEKIFQIPFWLQPIALDSNGPSLRTLLEQVAGDISPDEASLPQQSATTRESEPLAGTDRRPNSTTFGLQAPITVTQSIDTDSAVASDRVEEEKLQFYARELEVFEALGPLIARSPRTVKRFVNSYRLLRDRHRLDIERFTKEGPNAPYVVTAFLLAVEVGLSASERNVLYTAVFGKNEGDLITDMAEWTQPYKNQDLEEVGLPELAIDRASNAAYQLKNLGHRFDTRSLAAALPLVTRVSFHGPERRRLRQGE